MSYDAWKTTEPPQDGEPCQQCQRAKGVYLSNMSHTGVLLCEDCAGPMEDQE